MSELEQLLAQCSDSPVEPGPKHVAADWCEQRGNRTLAYALRWCAHFGKWPWKSPTVQKPSRWLRNGNRLSSDLRTKIRKFSYAVLPKMVFDRIACTRPYGRSYYSIKSDSALCSLEGLAEALAELRKVVPDLDDLLRANRA